jgi:hypothetical protein
LQQYAGSEQCLSLACENNSGAVWAGWRNR